MFNAEKYLTDRRARLGNRRSSLEVISFSHIGYIMV